MANDDTAATDEDTPVTIDVLGNDSDIDGDTLSVDSVTDPANGSVVNNDTDVNYTPDANFTGSDAFTYPVSDGHGGTDTATVTITVEGSSPPENLVHINTIEVTKQTWWIIRRGVARVQVVDTEGSPIQGATITGQWSGGANDADQFTTGSDGWGTTYSNWRWGNATFTFCVTNVSREGWDYDPDANVVTCGNTD